MDLLIFPIKQYNVPNPFRNPYGLPSKNRDKNTGHCLNNGFVSTFGIYDVTLIGLWYSVRIQETRTRNNSVFGHFSRTISVICATGHLVRSC